MPGGSQVPSSLVRVVDWELGALQGGFLARETRCGKIGTSIRVVYELLKGLGKNQWHFFC